MAQKHRPESPPKAAIVEWDELVAAMRSRRVERAFHRPSQQLQLHSMLYWNRPEGPRKMV